MDRGYSVGDSSTDSGDSVGDSSDSGYSVGDSSDSGYSVGDSSIDRGYSVGDSSTDSGIRVHSMADCSVVEERVSLSLRLSLTLAVHVVQTGVHVGVHVGVDMGNSHSTDSRSGDGVVGVVDRNSAGHSVDRDTTIDSSYIVDSVHSSYMVDSTVSNSADTRDNTVTMVNSSNDPTVCQTVGDLSYCVGVSLSLTMDRHSGQKYKDEGSHRAAASETP